MTKDLGPLDPALMDKLGPLAALVGSWKGDQGMNVSHDHGVGKVTKTPYREEMTFSAFGPVDNGRQHLYGLDYRTAAWKAGKEDPFHTEVGYWLWDSATSTVMRCFMVPRGSTILAGGQCSPDAMTFTMTAEAGQPDFGIVSNPYLVENANVVRYTNTVTIDGDTLSYEENTVLDMKEYDDLLDHPDSNVLTRA
ncbi:MAG: FABP family protein [Acidimicrobiia bacterium]